MKRTFSRLAAVALAVVTLLSLMVPVYASSEYVSKDNFWNWLAGKNGFVQKITAYTLGNKVCAKSSDGYHHATMYEQDNEDGYYLCICIDCGKRFRAYRTDLEQSHTDSVKEMEKDLGTPVITSSNALLWSPGHNYTLISTISLNNPTGVFCSHHDANATSFQAEFNCTDNSPNFFATPLEGEKRFSAYHHAFSYSGSAPVTGSYRLLSGRASVLTYNTGYGTGDQTVSYSYDAETAGKSYAKGQIITCDFWSPVIQTASLTMVSSFQSYYAQGYAPVYEVIPASELLPTIQNNYNIQSRLNSFNGEFGIIGDNGEITKVDNQYIVNETDNSVYNPVTNTTNTFQSWSYDYSSRTYNVTYDNGTTAVITYGDEYVTIKEGDTTYNIYYMLNYDNSGPGGPVTPDPGPGTGDDDNGILSGIGKLLGTIINGILSVLGAALDTILGGLIDLVQGAFDNLLKLVDLFGSFGEALSVLWMWLPDEIVTIFVTGVSVLVFIGLIKIFMK